MKPAVVLVDSETGERVAGITSVWLVVGRCGPGAGCQNFMVGDFEGGCEQGGEILSALGQLIGHMLYHAVVTGADRDVLDKMWGAMRQVADQKINFILAGQSEVRIQEGPS